MLAAPIIAHTETFNHAMCTVLANFYIFTNGLNSESIEQFIEVHAFVLAHDLVPRPPPLPFPVSKLDQQDIGRLHEK
jgi:hypothetical protein